ncbi:hypothetical protein GCM10010230_60500 [Streptomyces narbonensis]|nr:hypothetical protein GCM10010230_60500 [Streptomyces narbonensis]
MIRAAGRRDEPAHPPLRHLPAHQDLEGIPGPEREASPDRIEDVLDRPLDAAPGPGLHARDPRSKDVLRGR